MGGPRGRAGPGWPGSVRRVPAWAWPCGACRPVKTTGINAERRSSRPGQRLQAQQARAGWTMEGPSRWASFVGELLHIHAAPSLPSLPLVPTPGPATLCTQDGPSRHRHWQASCAGPSHVPGHTSPAGGGQSPEHCPEVPWPEREVRPVRASGQDSQTPEHSPRSLGLLKSTTLP